MSDRLVTIATFSHPPEAHLRKAKLESEGIPAFVADENTITANWLYSNAIGGVKLQVRESDVERALDILELERKHAGEDIDMDEDLACPFCDSRNVMYGRKERGIVGWLLHIFAPSKWYCRDCGYEWKQ